MRLVKLRHLGRAEFALVAQLAGAQHEHLLRGRGLHGVDDVDVVIVGHAPGERRALHSAGEGGGEQHAQDAVARGLRLFKDGQKCVRRGLGGFGVFPGHDARPEDVRGQGDAVLVGILAEGDLQRHHGQAVLPELVGGKIGGGIGDDTDHICIFLSKVGCRYRPGGGMMLSSSSVISQRSFAKDSAWSAPIRLTS